MLDWAGYVLKNFADQIGATIDVEAATARLRPLSRLSRWRQGAVANRLRAMKRHLLRKLR
jgi:hypothetical protein